MKTHAAIKKRSRSLGLLGIDKRTAVYHALAKWRDEMITDLGGQEGLSSQQLMILDEAMRLKIIADRADAEIASLETIIEGGHLIGAVKDRQALAKALTRSMVLLGLEKWKKPRPTMAEVLRAWGSKHPAHGEGVIEGESTIVEDGDSGA
jgi:hypothetical protein